MATVLKDDWYCIKPLDDLGTNEKMTGNLIWYPVIGFRETDRRKEDGFNRVYFRKDL